MSSNWSLPFPVILNPDFVPTTGNMTRGQLMRLPMSRRIPHEHRLSKLQIMEARRQ